MVRPVHKRALLTFAVQFSSQVSGDEPQIYSFTIACEENESERALQMIGGNLVAVSQPGDDGTLIFQLECRRSRWCFGIESRGT